MSVVIQLFEAMGGATKIATSLGLAVQTVDSWKANGNVPVWRRAPLMEAAGRIGAQLPPDVISYLASKERAA